VVGTTDIHECTRGPFIASPTKPEARLTLERAYSELSDADQKITARALRGRAKVDMNIAAAWLRARRTADKSPSQVLDDITATTAQVLHDQIVERIWDRYMSWSARRSLCRSKYRREIR